MAVNLDKEAYYRRIKRLYGNWKVKLSDLKRVEDCNVEKVALLEDASRLVSRVFLLSELTLCRRER